jgi:hypothetical protein|tara:strand:+ start:12066 stop:12221 length:156 start_codon:yes stop_codon:yes gene_type:complete
MLDADDFRLWISKEKVWRLPVEELARKLPEQVLEPGTRLEVVNNVCKQVMT